MEHAVAGGDRGEGKEGGRGLFLGPRVGSGGQQPSARASFMAESQAAHPHWWAGAAATLRYVRRGSGSAAGGGAGPSGGLGGGTGEAASFAPNPAAR